MRGVKRQQLETEQNMEIDGCIQYWPGIIKYQNLHKMFKSDNSQIQIHPSENERWKTLINEYNEMIASRHTEPPVKEMKILDLYFIHHIRPKTIASKLKVSRDRVYSVVRSIKKALFWVEEVWTKERKPKDFKQKVFTKLKDFCRDNAGLAYTVSDVRKDLIHRFQNKFIPSESSILRFMQRQLWLRFKRVSWRPPSQYYNRFVVEGETFASFFLQAEKEKIIILQVDEFSFNKSAYTAMAWGQKGVSSFCYHDHPNYRFSVIAAISNSGLELLTISNKWTNGDVFCNFLTLLPKEIKERYDVDQQKVIISCDGARYHLVSKADKILKQEGNDDSDYFIYTRVFTSWNLHQLSEVQSKKSTTQQ